MPGQPGPDGIRRNVQGTDQGAAPTADRHPGRQLQQYRRPRRDSVHRDPAGPLQRIGMAHLPQQQEQRSLHRPDLHRQSAVLPAGQRRSEDLRQAAVQQFAGQGALRAGHPEDAGPVHRALAPQGAGKLQHLLEDARVRRREPQGHRSESQVDSGIPRQRRCRRRHERSVDPLRVQDPVEGVQLRPARNCRQPGAPALRA
ncbi:hypothetical protein D3C73_910250 [compost metagenome]